jgi:hypothetical protein
MHAPVKKGRAVGYRESAETRALTARKRLSLFVYSTTGKVIPLDDDPTPPIGPRQSAQEIASSCGLQMVKGKVTT